jgi:hypothetical protein
MTYLSTNRFHTTSSKTTLEALTRFILSKQDLVDVSSTFALLFALLKCLINV